MAMRSMWRGSISFGMVSIPVRMYLATGDGDDVGFTQLCPEHPDSRVLHKKVCAGHDHLLTTQPLRGYEVAKGEYIVITDEDLESLPVPSAHQVQIREFVDRAELGDLYLSGFYYLEPEDVGAKAYALLREALRVTEKVAVGMVAMRGKEHFCRLSLEGDAIVLANLHFPNEIRSSVDLKLTGQTVNGAETAMAVALVGAMAVQTFDVAKYENTFGVAVKALVKARVNGEEPIVATQKPAETIDLMAQLQASLASVAA
jgi:DNA end-binding protein Ku